MKRIADPLRQMGVELECTEQGTLPVRIRAGNRLRGIAYDMPVASAQLKSCLLLAGLYAEGRTRVCEPAITRDHTERMLSAFGAKLSRENNCIEIVPGELQATSINVPADISSAAFFLVAASICPGSDLLLKNVGINPTRSAVIDILSKMGAEIRFERTQESGAEPVADIRVKHAPLQGIEIPPDLVPVAIDELPVIMVAAASARGDTVLTNAAELRVKESDRIEAMANGLSRLGIKVSTRKDGMTVTGGPLTGGEVDSFGDHRIAMAFAVAALNAKEPVRVKDTLNVNTSFPGFVDMASAVGMTIRTEPGHG
jgi:3-phosphoshikimate 1-carboxyvinyltransferase